MPVFSQLVESVILLFQDCKKNKNFLRVSAQLLPPCNKRTTTALWTTVSMT